MNPPAPGPVSGLSVTQETNAAAMHASTAFPPWASTLAPASAVSGWPAATAPRMGEGYSARRSSLLDRDDQGQPARPRSRPLRRRGWGACGRPRLAWAARSRPRGACVSAHAVPRSRLRALEQLLVRGPLQLRHLQPPVLPACSAARDPAARGCDSLDLRACLRRPALAGVGRVHALVESHLRGGVGRDRLLGGISVRARGRAGSARALVASGPQAWPFRAAGGPHARCEPAGLPVAHTAPGRLRDLPLGRPPRTARPGPAV